LIALTNHNFEKYIINKYLPNINSIYIANTFNYLKDIE